MRPIEDGVYTGVTRENYELIDRANFSKIKLLKKSPAHFLASMLQRAEDDTDALRIGRATHVAVLEPERFLSAYAIWDGGTRRGDLWNKFQKQHEGLEILKEDHYQQVRAIADAVKADKHAAKYLQNGSAEVTMLWTHKEPSNGVPGFDMKCKGRLDFGANAGAIVDLKTARDASPDGFSRAAWNLDYAVQAAFYRDGYAAAHGGELLPYVIVAVEKEPPYVVQVYRMPEQLLDMGRDAYRALLHRLNECRSTNSWPGYAAGPLDLELPRWMRSENDVSGLGLEFEGAESNG